MHFDKKMVRKFSHSEENSDGYVDDTHLNRFHMVEVMSEDLFSFLGQLNAKQRLQRNIIHLNKKGR
jgi:hypothetical protein